MSIADLFSKLGAPLKNTRWSWGAVSQQGDVYLRVWGDDFKKIEGKQTVRITHHRAFETDRENLGYQERLKHVALIGAGAKAFCVLCKSKDLKSVPRELESFDRKRILLGGALIQDGEDTRLELVQSINLDELK